MTKTKRSITSIADALIASRKVWEDGTFKASNDELYKLLGQCLDFYIAIAKDSDMSKALNALLKLKGFTYTNGTSIALKVARLVFADPAQPEKHKTRLQTYARVLTIAKSEKQTADTLSTFIIEQGGIDEIRRSSNSTSPKVEKAKKFRDNAEYLYSTNEQKPLCKLPALPQELRPAEGERYSIALVRDNGDDTGSIVFGTGNKSVLDQVLRIAGKHIDDQIVNERQKQEEDAKADRQEQNLAKLLEQHDKSFQAEVVLDNDVFVAEPV
jgi:hypothetical protein